MIEGLAKRNFTVCLLSIPDGYMNPNKENVSKYDEEGDFILSWHTFYLTWPLAGMVPALLWSCGNWQGKLSTLPRVPLFFFFAININLACIRN